METTIITTQNEHHEINFLDIQLPASEARYLILSFLNSRIEYHNQQLFGEMERNGPIQKEHNETLELLETVRKETDYLLLKAMTRKLKVSVKGRFDITLSYDTNS